MRSSQSIVLEDAQTLYFYDISRNFWELKVSVEGISTKIFLEIPDVAFCAALLVYLSETLAPLRISSGSETGVAGGPLGFSLVLGLIEATLYQWSHQIDDYNRNNAQALSIIKAWIYVVPREAELQSPLPGNIATLLSLQETPLGCSSRIPGNLQCFFGF